MALSSRGACVQCLPLHLLDGELWLLLRMTLFRSSIVRPRVRMQLPLDSRNGGFTQFNLTLCLKHPKCLRQVFGLCVYWCSCAQLHRTRLPGSLEGKLGTEPHEAKANFVVLKAQRLMGVSKYTGGGGGNPSPKAGNKSAEWLLAQQVAGASLERAGLEEQGTSPWSELSTLGGGDLWLALRSGNSCSEG